MHLTVLIGDEGRGRVGGDGRCRVGDDHEGRRTCHARRSVDIPRSESMLPATDVSDGDTPAGAILTSIASIGGAPARPRLSVSPAKSQRGPDEAAESTIQSDTTLMAFAASGGVRKSPFPVFDNVALLHGA